MGLDLDSFDRSGDAPIPFMYVSLILMKRITAPGPRAVLSTNRTYEYLSADSTITGVVFALEESGQRHLYTRKILLYKLIVALGYLVYAPISVSQF